MRWTFCCLIISLARCATAADDGLPCDSKIYCSGDLLHTVQTLKAFPSDSKFFVDLPLKVTEAEALAEFAKLGAPDKITLPQIQEFLNKTFKARPEEDLRPYKPTDFKPISQGGMSIYANITDANYKALAEAIHIKWESLGRQIPKTVEENQRQHSIIYLPHPFIIPGGRFREIYYWDSFWTIQGLLVSGMAETARGMIRNFIHLVNTVGHIPNGNRVYYMKRSQPPFLALMVEAFVNHKDTTPAAGRELIDEALPALVKEHKFWTDNRVATFTYNSKNYTLNIYKGGISEPRPESYREDREIAETLPADQQERFYRAIGAGAESGWDFSTRWMDTQDADFNTIRTHTIVPVDLNALLCAHERILGDYYTLTGNTSEAERFKSLAQKRGDEIHEVFWNDAKAMWRDYDLKTGAQREDFYISHIAPLFTRCSGSTVNITATPFMNRLLHSYDMKTVTSYPGGVPQGLKEPNKHTQWDLPNAWPPHQLMLVESFAANSEFRSQALQWAQKWVTAVDTGHRCSGYFYEKYDVNKVGAYGGGGEYAVQEGFGWTNGGILRLLELFPSELRAPASHTCPATAAPPTATIGTTVASSATTAGTSFMVAGLILGSIAVALRGVLE
ncbi:Trehalase [Hypsibius exemplaris]|uniref:Trehalase n=1 Tax=Hypsibius exemplaris TaxID=2072580 RepID=A0A1W0WGN6_HYPEX|nr:Trehalase [Hypsibius exemplaris]